MRFIRGASYKQDLIIIPVTANFLYQSIQGVDEKEQFGCELVLKDRIFLRAGSDEAGLHGGVGFQFMFFQKKIDLGYSFLSHDLGKAHRFDFTIRLS